MAEKNYWYSSLKPPLDPEAAAEAKTIVDAFGAREIPIEIGGFPDDAEEDDELHGGGIAFMYAKDRILAREPYLAAMGMTPDLPERVRVTRPQGILEIISEDERVQEVEITRVVGDIVLLRLESSSRPGRLLTVTSPMCSNCSSRSTTNSARGSRRLITS